MCETLLSVFLEKTIVEFFLLTVLGILGEAENWTGQGAAESLRPPEHFLLYHLEQAFSVDRANIHLSLETSYLIGPRHRLSSQPIRSELHETLIDSVEEAFVLYMDALPHHLRLL